jgi:hypothetical protein
MNTALDAASRPPSPIRSTFAIVTGLLTIIVLSLATDLLLQALGVYPPGDQPMNETSDNLFSLSYRLFFNTFGCWFAAYLAPRNPMKHALILGTIGFVLATVGAVGAVIMKLGPAWYPILLALSPLPCAWLGGAIHRRYFAKA